MQLHCQSYKNFCQNKHGNDVIVNICYGIEYRCYSVCKHILAARGVNLFLKNDPRDFPSF